MNKKIFAKPVTMFLMFGILAVSVLPQMVISESKEDNSLKFCEAVREYEVKNTIKMMVTAYSSTPEETWGDPFITASGKHVEDGIIANNMLPFGTKVRIPDLYGDKVFVVQDRMHSRKGNYHADIWFEVTKEAKNFGAKVAYIEVLRENL